MAELNLEGPSPLQAELERLLLADMKRQGAAEPNGKISRAILVYRGLDDYYFKVTGPRTGYTGGWNIDGGPKIKVEEATAGN